MDARKGEIESRKYTPYRKWVSVGVRQCFIQKVEGGHSLLLWKDSVPLVKWQHERSPSLFLVLQPCRTRDDSQIGMFWFVASRVAAELILCVSVQPLQEVWHWQWSCCFGWRREVWQCSVANAHRGCGFQGVSQNALLQSPLATRQFRVSWRVTGNIAANATKHTCKSFSFSLRGWPQTG